MKTWKRISLILVIIGVVAICCIAIRSDIFSAIADTRAGKVALAILTNQYVSGILCSIIAIVILYVFQKEYSKYKIKRDFRCNEIISNIYYGIELTESLLNKCPEIKFHYSDDEEDDAIKMLDYCTDNMAYIWSCDLSFTYANNKLLIESIEASFFINLNFKLLGIINNIKNRIPNLTDKYPGVDQRLKCVAQNGITDNVTGDASFVGHYLIDLQFMAKYWTELLDYLGYDSTYVNKCIELYNREYDIKEDLKSNVAIRNEHCKKAMKKAKKEVLKERIKKLWR